MLTAKVVEIHRSLVATTPDPFIAALTKVATQSGHVPSATAPAPQPRL